MTVTCAGCSATFPVPPEVRGKTIRCTTCGTYIKLPPAAGPEARPRGEDRPAPVRRTVRGNEAGRRPAGDDETDEMPRRRTRPAWRAPVIAGMFAAGCLIPVLGVTFWAVTRGERVARSAPTVSSDPEPRPTAPLVIASAPRADTVGVAAPAPPDPNRPLRLPTPLQGGGRIAGDDVPPRPADGLPVGDPKPPRDGPAPRAPEAAPEKAQPEPLARVPEPLAPPPDRPGTDDMAPETRALITKTLADLKSKSASVRVTAYQTLGDLGPKAKGQRRVMCEGLLDAVPAVRAAAADALKKVDEPIHRMAMAIGINKDFSEVHRAGQLGPAAEPLTPLLIQLVQMGAGAASRDEFKDRMTRAQVELTTCTATLARIAPDDPAVNQAVINMLDNPSMHLRAAALRDVSRLKNRKLALPAVLRVAAAIQNRPETRAAAVLAVPELVDENSTPAARKAVELLRFDVDSAVRDAVDVVSKQLK